MWELLNLAWALIVFRHLESWRVWRGQVAACLKQSRTHSTFAFMKSSVQRLMNHCLQACVSARILESFCSSGPWCRWDWCLYESPGSSPRIRCLEFRYSMDEGHWVTSWWCHLYIASSCHEAQLCHKETLACRFLYSGIEDVESGSWLQKVWGILKGNVSVAACFQPCPGGKMFPTSVCPWFVSFVVWPIRPFLWVRC